MRIIAELFSPRRKLNILFHKWQWKHENYVKKPAYNHEKLLYEVCLAYQCHY